MLCKNKSCLLPPLFMLAFFWFSLATPPPASAIDISTKGPTSTAQRNVIMWLYTTGYTQLALLERPWKDMISLQWKPDGSKWFKVRWRDGKIQVLTLRLPSKNLVQTNFLCHNDGYIHLQVIDCKTKKPIRDALVADITGKQFHGLPTGPDGWGRGIRNDRHRAAAH